ncbi:MAG: hypothetical protein C4B58_05155 [Deltaproteobacteria bacterium]|nr:MAG: hypothetical protein C4B58_05155 [Deltaproteobacteria bacterium]
MIRGTEIILGLFRRNFVRNVASLASGTALSQVLIITTAPILSRLYDPNVFGILGIYTASVGILAAVSSWRYELAIVLPKEDRDAVNVMMVALFILGLMTSLTGLTIAVGGNTITAWLDVPELYSWLWWIPVSLILIGSYQILGYWSTRRQYFRQLSVTRILRSIGLISTQTSVGALGAGVGGLISGNIVGQAIACKVLGLQIWRKDGRLIRRSMNVSRMHSLAHQYADFPKFQGGQSLLNAFSQNMPLILMAYFFDPAVVGFYVMADRVLRLPINLISQSVRQVFYQRVSEIYNSGLDVYSFFKKSIYSLIAIGAIPFGLIMVFGPCLFEGVLGAPWRTSGYYSQWLAIWLFGGFINPPAMIVLTIMRKLKLLFLFELLYICAKFVAIFVGGSSDTPMLSIALYSLVGGVFNVILIFSAVINLKIQPDLNTRK